MAFDSQSATIINSVTHFPISQRYRQSLQPYVDPEILEVGYYQPQAPETGSIAPSKVADKKHEYPKAIVVLALVAFSLLGYCFQQHNDMAAWRFSWQISNVK